MQQDVRSTVHPNTGEDSVNKLDPRKQAILKAVCTEYIARAEPVGSELLASQYSLGVRSATLRNEMAEMTDLGYLRQPHTSAGRVPSDRGYRFYVDRLMALQPLQPNEHQTIRRLQDFINQQVDEILREACSVVAALTRYTSVATPPIVKESRLSSIRLLVLDPRRILVVLVLESGRVEHQVVEIQDLGASKIDVEYLQAALETVFVGQTCGDLAVQPDFSRYPPRERRLLERIAAEVREGLHPRTTEDVVVQGETNALREPEFHDLNRLDRLLDLLHSRKAIYEMLSVADGDSPVAVIIGSESGYEQAKEYSFIAARYCIAGATAGAIGVFGPTRMRYSQAVPVVQSVARQVTSVLSNLVGEG